MRWLAGLDAAARHQARIAIEDARLQTPAPIRDAVASARWRTLVRADAWLDFFDSGEGEGALAAEREAWLRGGDDLTYLRRRVLLGDAEEALALADSLRENGGARGHALEDFTLGRSLLPPELEAAIDALPMHATYDETAAVLGGAPDELRAFAIRRALVHFADAPASLRFALACHGGMTRDALAMVEGGEVTAPDVASRSAESDAVGRGLWLGLAARVAARNGDDLGVVRYLRQGFERAEGPLFDRDMIWETASDRLRQLMRAAGLAPP
ncbi:MAG: hypothetical protein AAF938_30230 [Myxococcota bacterium]